jgi:hypothetical protein
MPGRKQIKAVEKAIGDAFKKRIPSGREIAAKAVTEALRRHGKNPSWIKKNFSRLVEDIQVAAYEAYLKEERKAGTEALCSAFLPLVPKKGNPKATLRCVAGYFPALDRFFLSLTQGRRPRAGSAFDFLLRELFERLRYPFTSQPVINGQPDFVMPSVDHFMNNPPDAIIFTVKRTLRERWGQIITEGTRGLGFFLATIDEDISGTDLRRILAARITLVVPARVKRSREDYKKAHHVITFEQFFRFHLDPKMKKWRADGVLTARSKRR